MNEGTSFYEKFAHKDAIRVNTIRQWMRLCFCFGWRRVNKHMRIHSPIHCDTWMNTYPGVVPRTVKWTAVGRHTADEQKKKRKKICQNCVRHSHSTYSFTDSFLTLSRSHTQLHLAQQRVLCAYTYLLLWLISRSRPLSISLPRTLLRRNTFFSNIFVLFVCLFCPFTCGPTTTESQHTEEKEECFMYADNLCSIFCICCFDSTVRTHTHASRSRMWCRAQSRRKRIVSC